MGGRVGGCWKSSVVYIWVNLFENLSIMLFSIFLVVGKSVVIWSHDTVL